MSSEKPVQVTLYPTEFTFTPIPRVHIKVLDAEYSYLVQGHKYVTSFKKGYWDGKIHLIKFKTRLDRYAVPIGLWPEFRAYFQKNNIRFQARGRGLKPKGVVAEIESKSFHPIRPYQQRAIDAVTPKSPRGILKLPVRSGKTFIAAEIMAKLKVPFLFCVPSRDLLTQTVEAFQDYLDADIGQLGAGVWKEGDVNVATVQTLLAHPDKTRKMMKGMDGQIFDECHHLKADQWKEIMLGRGMDCHYKLGLSATVYFDPGSEVLANNIWLKAATGPVLCDISPSELIRQGYLMKPDIRMIPIEGPAVEAGWRGGGAYAEGVVEHHYRNQSIVKIAVLSALEDKRVLIITRRLEHIRILAEMCLEAGLQVDFIHGDMDGKKRKVKKARFEDARTQVMIGTVFGEGINIPWLEVVINAEGGAKIESTMQRLRNMTVQEGKGDVVFYDFADLHHDHLARHSHERLKHYLTEEEFQISAHTPGKLK